MSSGIIIDPRNRNYEIRDGEDGSGGKNTVTTFDANILDEDNVILHNAKKLVLEGVSAREEILKALKLQV